MSIPVLGSPFVNAKIKDKAVTLWGSQDTFLSLENTVSRIGLQQPERGPEGQSH